MNKFLTWLSNAKVSFGSKDKSVFCQPGNNIPTVLDKEKVERNKNDEEFFIKINLKF